MTVEERLEKVERELAQAKRLLRPLVVVGAIAVACLIVLRAVWPDLLLTHAEVRARSFVLVDEKGQTCASLSANILGSELELFDTKGQPGAALSASSFGSKLELFDKRGHLSASLKTSVAGPVLKLLDDRDHLRAMLGLDLAESLLGQIGLDARGGRRAQLDPVFAGISLDYMSPGLTLYDSEGRTRAVVLINGNGGAIAGFDEAGTAIWRAPQ